MTIALRPANSNATKTLRYSYSGGADATALTMTSANVILDRTISLPGGVVVTGVTAATSTWAYPNIHGDVTYAINGSGAVTGPYVYDPYVQPLTGVSNTSPGDYDNGWQGQHQRPTEHQTELRSTIEMRARPYRADLGRFLRVDPVDEGATFSDYAYVNDPINQFDPTGQRCSGREGRGGRKCGVDFNGTGRLTRHGSVAGLGHRVSNGAGYVVSSVGSAVSSAVSSVKNVASGVGDWLGDHWRGLLTSAAFGWLFRAVCLSTAVVLGIGTAGVGAFLVGLTCIVLGMVISQLLQKSVDD